MESNSQSGGQAAHPDTRRGGGAVRGRERAGERDGAGDRESTDGTAVEPVDEVVARRAAELLAGDDEWGGDPGADLVGAMIAGVADKYGEPVLTENVGDFERLGVTVETW
ncbi:MAG: hypothetical protein ABEI27_15000 [Halobellus sp.]|uniref:hypothetical protein n=1 Tax=Halobellus sp. TaxID=1979212 RepID=UPI0035D4DA8B